LGAGHRARRQATRRRGDSVNRPASNGDRPIADRKAGGGPIFAGWKFVSTFSNVNAERLAVSRLEDVAMLDREAKASW
jgi:hypothetical protein